MVDHRALMRQLVDTVMASLLVGVVCVAAVITGCLQGSETGSGTYHSWTVTVGEKTWVAREQPAPVAYGNSIVEGAWRFIDEEGAEVTVPVNEAIIVRQTLSE